MTWSQDLAHKTYSIRHWADGYFEVNDAGHMVVMPLGGDGVRISLPEVVDAARAAGASYRCCCVSLIFCGIVWVNCRRRSFRHSPSGSMRVVTLLFTRLRSISIAVWRVFWRVTRGWFRFGSR